MKEKESGLFYLVFVLVSILINLLSVSLHESGHAIIYLIQGYRVSFHYTKADPINGVETVLGAAGGVSFNLVFAVLFLILFIKHKNIIFYSAIAANTLFSRIVPGVVFLLIGKAPKDETFIGNSLNINPLFIEIFIIILLTGIFILATRTLIISKPKRHPLFLILLTLIACILSFAITIPLDSKGI